MELSFLIIVYFAKTIKYLAIQNQNATGIFLLFLSTASNTPALAINTTSELPPLLINGSGKPVGGIVPVTTAILSKVCIAMTQLMPADK